MAKKKKEAAASQARGQRKSGRQKQKKTGSAVDQ